MAFHLIINWSPIAAALIAGRIVGHSAVADFIGYLCISSAIAAWLLFNFLHRQVNRLRNIVFTTAIASILVLAAIALIS
jgi:hypothetical protein